MRANKILNKYNNNNGSIRIPILIGSTVGLIAAANMDIKTTAIRHCFANAFAVINLNLASIKISKGASKHNPIQKTIFVTKLM